MAEDLRDRLVRLAGVTTDVTLLDIEKWPSNSIHGEFLHILRGFALVGGQKQRAYGDSRLTVRSVDYDTKMLFSDIYRKYIRLEHMTWSNTTMDAQGRMDAFIETLGDIGVYAARGIQIARRLEDLTSQTRLTEAIQRKQQEAK